MAQGNFTGTAASTTILAASRYRDQVVFQHTNDTQCALGIGEDAVAGKGLQLINAGDAVVLKGAESRAAISVIGDGATGTYQTGNVDVRPGGNS